VITVKKEKVIPSMVLAEDLSGTNKLILRAGTVLTPRFISLLQINNLFPIELIPVTNESYNLALLKVSNEIRSPDFDGQQDPSVADEIFSRFKVSQVKEGNFEVESELLQCSEQLHIPGNLSVQGNIKNCSSIFVSGSLSVHGDIIDSNLTVKKDLIVSGCIRNTVRGHKIQAFGLISAESIERSELNAGSIQATKLISNSDMIVDNNIEGPPTANIQNSRLQAGYNIILGSVSEGTTLVIYSDRQSKIIQKLFEMEKKIRDFDKEIEPLKQSIKIFQLLKDRLHELPEDKRDKLLSHVRLVRTKLEKKKFFQDQYITYKQESDNIKKSRGVSPIIIEAEVAKGTRIVIDNSTFIVQTQDKGVVFYKKSIIIMGKKDKEWGRIS
jgi:hypothetical protein